MARTYRRQKGDQHWRNHRCSWVNLMMPEYQMGLISDEKMAEYIKADEEDVEWYRLCWERDKCNYNPVKPIKAVSNERFRSNERKQIQRLMREEEWEEFEYDPTRELQTKHLWWVYD